MRVAGIAPVLLVDAFRHCRGTIPAVGVKTTMLFEYYFSEGIHTDKDGMGTEPQLLGVGDDMISSAVRSSGCGRADFPCFCCRLFSIGVSGGEKATKAGKILTSGTAPAQISSSVNTQ